MVLEESVIGREGPNPHRRNVGVLSPFCTGHLNKQKHAGKCMEGKRTTSERKNMLFESSPLATSLGPAPSLLLKKQQRVEFSNDSFLLASFRMTPCAHVTILFPPPSLPPSLPLYQRKPSSSPFVFAFLIKRFRVFPWAPTKVQNSVMAWEWSEIALPRT
jgi:hypothetical protein